MLEADFKRWVRRECGIWTCVVEPGFGASMGVADLFVLKKGLLLPVELKVGKLDNGKVKCNRVRPDQISWMDGLVASGGECRLLIGVVENGEWVGYGTRDCSAKMLSRWKGGWAVGELERMDTRNAIVGFFGP